MSTLLRPLQGASRNRLKAINIIALLLICSSALLVLMMPAYAASPLSDTDVTFNPVSGDVSIGLLQAILGNWKIATPDATMGPLFRSFNLGVMVFGACLFLYASTEGIMRSAEDGEVLGRKWGSWFVPMRMTAGMALLFPMANGFSGIQIVVLWLATQGIGFADWAANMTIDGFVSNQGAVISAQVVTAKEMTPLMSSILQAEVCVAEYNRTHVGTGGTPLFGGPYTYGNQPDQSNSYRKIYWGPVQNLETLTNEQRILIGSSSADQCGSIEIDNFNSIGPWGNGTDIINTAGSAIVGSVSQMTFGSNMNTARSAVRIAHANAISDAATNLRPVAQAFVNGNARTGGLTNQNLAAIVANEAGSYSQKIAQSLGPDAIPSTSEMNSAMKSMVADAGWSTLGTWFYQYARINSELSKIVNYTPSYTPPTNKTSTEVEVMLSALDSAIVQSAANPITAKQIGSAGMPQSVGSAQGGAWGYLNNGNFASNKSQFMGEVFGVDPTNKTNAIIQLKNVGDNILSLEEAAAAVVLAAKLSGKTTSVAASAVGKLSGFAKALGPIASIAQRAIDLIIGGAGWVREGAGVFVLVTITTFAVLLAFWIPMLPVILWIGSFMGWLIAVCEMVVAAPLFAAAHLHPEGEGMASRYGANGYMIIIEVFAKPILMVVGFFVAARFSDPFIRFVSSIFFTSMRTATGDSLNGIVTIIMFTLMYVVLCVSLITRSFSLIHIVPNSVMRWIGGNGGMFDQAENMGEMLRGQVANSMGNVIKVLETAGVAKIASTRNQKNAEEQNAKDKERKQRDWVS